MTGSFVQRPLVEGGMLGTEGVGGAVGHLLQRAIDMSSELLRRSQANQATQRSFAIGAAV